MSATRESAEDYLETILILSRRLPVVRATDVAKTLNYKNSSVSVAMKSLKGSGYINVSEQGYITLTPAGKKIASSVYERHEWFTNWLISLGVKPEIASADACKMEHAISKESFSALKKSIKY